MDTLPPVPSPTAPRWPYRGRRERRPVSGAPAIELEMLSAQYVPGSPALHALDLRVRVGDRVAIVGPNGAGKSTLLRVLAGILAPTSGHLRIFGNPVGSCHHRVAYLPQRGELQWDFPITVERLALTGRYVHTGWLRRPTGEDRDRAAAGLERLGLAAVARRQIGELSGGQQQRLLLARAWIQDADLLLLDEPWNAIDAASRRIVHFLLDELRTRGKTVLIATHELDAATSSFDDALFLLEGRSVAAPGLPGRPPR